MPLFVVILPVNKDYYRVPKSIVQHPKTVMLTADLGAKALYFRILRVLGRTFKNKNKQKNQTVNVTKGHMTEDHSGPVTG